MNRPGWLGDRCGVGSPVLTCHCGRVHYDASGEFMDAGELDELERQRALRPRQYVPSADGAPYAVDFAGVLVVDGCPCEFLTRFRRMVLAEPAAVKRLLQEAATELRRRAAEMELPE